MNVLVTGAAGFIGRRVVGAARQKGFSVTDTSRSPIEGTKALDVTDPSTFRALRARAPYDAVVHCAGIAHRSGGVSVDDYRRVNVEGTRNVVGLAAECGAKTIVVLSSVLVYGRHGVGIKENNDCQPRDGYAASKLQSENVAIETGLKSGMSVIVLRPAPVIGEGCKGNFARLIRAVDRGGFITIGDGSARKSMIYVGDLADACVRLIDTGWSGEPQIFNIAGETVTTGELLNEVHQNLGKIKPRITLPSGPISLVLNGLAKATNLSSLDSAVRSLETWTSDDVYSADAIMDKVGFTATTSIPEAVRRTVAAYRAQAAP